MASLSRKLTDKARGFQKARLIRVAQAALNYDEIVGTVLFNPLTVPLPA